MKKYTFIQFKNKSVELKKQIRICCTMYIKNTGFYNANIV